MKYIISIAEVPLPLQGRGNPFCLCVPLVVFQKSRKNKIFHSSFPLNYV